MKSRASKHRATAMNFRAMCHDFAVNYTPRSSLAPSPRDRVPRIMRIKRRIFAYFERGVGGGWRTSSRERERERRLIEDNSRMRYNSSAQDAPRPPGYFCGAPRFVNRGNCFAPFQTAENDPEFITAVAAVARGEGHYLMAQTMILLRGTSCFKLVSIRLGHDLAPFDEQTVCCYQVARK